MNEKLKKGFLSSILGHTTVKRDEMESSDERCGMVNHEILVLSRPRLSQILRSHCPPRSCIHGAARSATALVTTTRTTNV